MTSATDNRTTELLREAEREIIILRDKLRIANSMGAKTCVKCGTFLSDELLCTECAATLGRPKVKKVRGLTYDEHGGEVYYLACSGCGEWIDGDLDCIGEADGPNFCHNCGGEFDGPLLCKWCGELADMEFGDMCGECYWGEGEGNDER